MQTITLPFREAVSFTDSDPRLPGVLFTAQTWTRSPRLYQYDPAAQRTIDTGLQPPGPFDAPPGITSTEVEARSYDGAMVPLSIIYRRGLKLDGTHPTLLEGYGAYGTTLTPSFNPTLLPWLERGAIYAVAHVRGGGAKGATWHRAGMKLTKPNSWRDFLACARYLIDHKYTSPAHLGAEGVSAGGITVGRAITERPDLFGAADLAVAILDTVRYSLTAGGIANATELGDTKTQASFEDLYRMSPYAHVCKGTSYPALLLIADYNDPESPSGKRRRWRRGCRRR